MDFNIIGNRVEVTGKNSGNYHGARAYFDGTYYKTAATPVKEAGVPGTHAPAPPRAAPDDPADAITIALDHLDHIDIVLQGYRGLTERLRKNHTLAESVLQKHAGTDRETQNLGFRNWPAALRGTLLAQQDELADLRLRLAETGNAPSERIEELRTKAAAARAALETFRKNQPPPAD
jgi:hypothetical protein